MRCRHVVFRVFFLPLLLVLTFCSAATGKVLDRSAFSWGGFRSPNSLQPGERENRVFEIFVRQNWLIHELPNTGRVSLFGETYFLRDAAGFDFNNKQKLGFGAEVKFAIRKWGQLSFGLKYELDQRPYSGLVYSGLSAIIDLSVYHSWPSDWATPQDRAKTKLVLNGWTNIRYPGAIDPSGKANPLLQGSYDLSLNYPNRGGKTTFAPFVSMGFSTDSKKFGYNNKFETALGMRLKFRFGKSTDLIATAKRVNDRRFTRGTTTQGTVFSLTWFKIF